MKKRLFIAVSLPPDVEFNIHEIQQEWRRHLGDQARWIAPHLAHVTIHFLGDVEEGRQKDISEIMRQSLSGLTPFVFTFQNLDAFPKPSQARAVIIRITEIGGHFSQTLYERLANRLRAEGFLINDRMFTPHLTLGRLRRPSKVTTAWYKHRSVAWSVREVHLMESVLGPVGAQYKTIATVSLS